MPPREPSIEVTLPCCTFKEILCTSVASLLGYLQGLPEKLVPFEICYYVVSIISLFILLL